MRYYPIILTTGLCSLIYQVIWQRYLTIIFGSEARSTTIIIAIFLLGLALGYYLFGRLTEKVINRRNLLKIYGWAEIITGAYAIMFSSFFWALASSPLGQGSFYAAEIFMGLILLLLPTILMGGTVPVMTSVLPAEQGKINQTHAQIYGINTLGGMLGIFIGSFFIIPNYGLAMGLTLIGAINLLAGVIYLLNRLEGTITNQSEKSYIKTSIPSRTLYFWAFISGAIVIALEIIWFRITALSIGSSHLVFPLILSLFIFGLGYGALTSQVNSLNQFKSQLKKSLFYLTLSLIIAPWLPLIVSNIRVSMTSIAPNYYIFYTLVYLLFALILLPFVIPMGRILPAVFSLIPKNERNFGMLCGKLYFINTLGTFVGATFFGYLLFHLLDLDAIFKTLIFLYALILISLIYYHQQKNKAYILAGVSIVVLIFIPFSRHFHSYSLFRQTQFNPALNWNLTPLKEHHLGDIVFLEDGPDSTAAVSRSERDGHLSLSIWVNGKSDSNTIGDYGTLTLSALIPYFYLPTTQSIISSIIGAGTGVTAATLEQLPSVDEVHLIEISSSVIKALPYFDDFNYQLTHSDKLTVHHTDAFRYYRNLQEKQHLIISEPTNPWTVGVENLYTKYFYQQIVNKLRPEGIFYQWFHTYSADNLMITTVLSNMSQFFPYIHLYQTQQGDIGFVASLRPLKIQQHKIQAAMDIEIINHVMSKLSLSPKSLTLLKKYNHHEVKAIVDTNRSLFHDVDFPIINYYALRPFFLGQSGNTSTLLSPYISRHLPARMVEKRINILTEVSNFYAKGEEYCRKNAPYPNIFCLLQRPLIAHFNNYQNITTRLEGEESLKANDYLEALQSYAFLRKERLLEKDISFLEHVSQYLRQREHARLMNSLIEEYLKEGLFDNARSIVQEIEDERQKEALLRQISIHEKELSKFKREFAI